MQGSAEGNFGDAKRNYVRAHYNEEAQTGALWWFRVSPIIKVRKKKKKR